MMRLLAILHKIAPVVATKQPRAVPSALLLLCLGLRDRGGLALGLL